MNVHVSAMCSPARAALLTGRNAHRAGMGVISEWSMGHPGYRGRTTREAATLAGLLRADGYATTIVGTWHLTRKREVPRPRPSGNRPLGRGFDR